MNIKKTIFTGLLSFAFIFPIQHVFAETSDYYQLWKDEALSKSANPTNLDNFSDNIYTNYQFGYKLNIPEGWEIDNHQTPNYTRFFSPDFRLDIYFEDVSKSYKTVDEYISETTSAIQNNIIKKEDSITDSGLKIQVVEYKRNEITRIKQDMTSYAYFFVISGKNVYTFQLKTFDTLFETKKNEILQLIRKSTYTQPKLTNVNESYTPSSESPTIDLKAERKSLKINPNKIAFGIYEPGEASNISTRETELDTHFGTQMFYKPISKPYDHYVDDMVDNGKIPLVTIHFDYINESTTTSDNVQKIINGEFDQEITSWAEGIKNTQSPVLVRLGNEMNGSWTSWSHKNIYNDADLYKIAYRHIVSIYRQNGADNAYFVWNPNDISKPNYSWNNAAIYYPGDSYVDWIGLTAYNFAKEGKDFKYFDDLYGELYKTYMRSFAGKPFLIGEFASVETAGNKPYFIKDMFEKIRDKYPNLKLVIWFNGEKENGLPFDSSLESKSAFKEGVRSSNIINHPIVDNIPDGLKILTPNNSETTNSNWTFTGIALDSNIESVYLNGIQQTYRWSSWRQFDESFALNNGENLIKITVNYKDGTKNTYDYYIYKNPSFKLSTQLSSSGSNAPINNKYQIVITGFVKDKNVSTMKINGKNVGIYWSWRQFDSEPLTLKHGLNEFNIEGYDQNGKRITNETYYVFKDGDLKVTSPNASSSNVYSHTRTITGMVMSPNVKWVKVDGINQTLKYAWRQFDQALSLAYGDNEFYVDGTYEYTNSYGEKIYYPLHKKYKIHAPSFDFLNYVSYYPTYAGQSASKSTFVEGILKDKRINSLKINGEPVTLLYDWKQFKHPVTLKNGLNAFILSGYSDADFKNKIVDETVYLFNDGDLNITSLKNTYINSTKDTITVTGLVSNPKITSVKINGILQTLKWSWRQFDQQISLSKPGNNKIEIEAVYKDYENGIPYTKVITKSYVVHKPSFTFQTPVSHNMNSAPQTSNSTEVLKGTVIDGSMKSLKIDGKEMVIGSDKSFTYSAALKPGMNGIVLTGYSDAQYTNKLFEETVYIFNDKGFQVDSPATNNVTLNSKQLKISGILQYSSYKSLKVNGVNVELLYAWRQFSKSITLPVGENKVVLEALYESTYNGEPYQYTAKKVYKATVPVGVSSYQFTTPVGSTPTSTPKTNDSITWLGALVKNSEIKYVKVNGSPVPIMYSWRQISTSIPLSYGLNTISIQGFSDSAYQNKIDQETVYIWRN